MSGIRERKPAAAPAAVPAAKQEEDDSKSKRPSRRAEVDAEPNIFVLSAMFIVFTVVVGTGLFYHIDSRANGDFSTWVNEKIPAVDRYYNGAKAAPLFGAAAQETTSELKLTEEELKAYTGEDADKPIYLAIDGIIYDVSVSPGFYGPGGHYHHFVGKDATRAWVTECWDEPEQFTWRMDDVEVMFMPKWMDENIERAGAGDMSGLEDLTAMPADMRGTLAKKLMERFGTVTDGTKKRRREEDQKEATDKVTETLEKWKSFFANNEKYKAVGSVIRDETRPTPPKPCDEAMKKRPLKPGKLEPLMGQMTNIKGMAPGDKEDEIPDFVKQKIVENKAKADAEKVEDVELGRHEEEEEQEKVRDEL